MKFLPDRRPNPFDNPLIGLGFHLVVAVVLCAGAYFSLAWSSFLPLGASAVVLTILEAVWWRFLFRR